MCGIVGVASINHQINKDWLNLGIKELNHRGPDGEGIWWDSENKVGF